MYKVISKQHTAYLLMHVRDRIGALPFVVDIRIYSEPTPTALVGDHFAFLASHVGTDFEDAERRLLDYLPHSGAAWALPYLKDRVAATRASKPAGAVPATRSTRSARPRSSRTR